MDAAQLEATRPKHMTSVRWESRSKAREVLASAIMSSPHRRYELGYGEYKYVYVSEMQELLRVLGLLTDQVNPQRELGKILHGSDLVRLKTKGFGNKWIIRFKF